MGKITLTNIAEELAAASGMSKEASDNFVRALIDTIEKGLQEDNVVKVKGLGTFKLMDMSDRGSVDINTGERITIKGYRKVSFTPDSAMKEFVNRPFAHFEPTELNDGYPAEEEEVPVAEDDDKAEETITSEEQIDAVAEIAAEKSVMEEPVAEEVAVEDVDIPSESDSVPEQAGCSAHEGEEIGVQEETTVTDSPSANTDTVEEPVVIVSEQTSVEETEIPEQEEVPAVTLEQEEKEKPSIASEAAPEHCDTPSKKSSKRGRGAGWLIALLLLALAYGIYYLTTVSQGSTSKSKDHMEEYDEMMVNPNLEEEFGDEWGDEPKVKTHSAPKKQEKSEENTTINSEASDKPSQAQTNQPSEKVEKSDKATAADPSTTKSVAADVKFCVVTPTESLEAKEIKDIIPADTTDYVIDGTLITHELKKGETIIQLAKKYYGDKRLWPYIVKYNWMKDYNNVAIGQMINIPVLKDKTAL